MKTKEELQAVKEEVENLNKKLNENRNSETTERAELSEAELEQIFGGGSIDENCFSYTVKKNECLSEIAEKNHTTVAVLQTINHIFNANLIKEGAVIQIPRKKK